MHRIAKSFKDVPLKSLAPSAGLSICTPPRMTIPSAAARLNLSSSSAPTLTPVLIGRFSLVSLSKMSLCTSSTVLFSLMYVVGSTLCCLHNSVIATARFRSFSIALSVAPLSPSPPGFPCPSSSLRASSLICL